MNLSPRTLLRKNDWTELIRTLPEGEFISPDKLKRSRYDALKAVCIRENRYKTEFYYRISCAGGVVRIFKERRMNDGESTEQQLQAERTL